MWRDPCLKTIIFSLLISIILNGIVLCLTLLGAYSKIDSFQYFLFNSIKLHGGLFEGMRLIVKSELWHGGLFEGGLIEGRGLHWGFTVSENSQMVKSNTEIFNGIVKDHRNEISVPLNRLSPFRGEESSPTNYLFQIWDKNLNKKILKCVRSLR